MKEEQQRFLSLLGQLPARLTAEQAGWVLNCQPHDIPPLVNARLLKPLGSFSQNSTKYFATAEVLEMTKDRGWLVKVSKHHLPALAKTERPQKRPKPSTARQTVTLPWPQPSRRCRYSLLSLFMLAASSRIRFRVSIF